MNISSFTGVDDDSFAGVGEGKGHGLGLAQLGPITSGGFRQFSPVVGKLNPVEREVPLVPKIAPRADHQREKVAVLVGTFRIGFTLIPNYAANAVADGGIEHTVKKIGWAILTEAEIAGSALGRGRLAGGLPRFEFRKGSGVNLVGVGGSILVPRLEVGGVIAFGFEHVAWHPGIGGRSAPCVVDEADGHANGIVNAATEHVADGGKICDSFRGARFPLSFEVIERRLAGNIGDRDQPDLRVVGGHHFDIGVIDAAERSNHV